MLVMVECDVHFCMFDSATACMVHKHLYTLKGTHIHTHQQSRHLPKTLHTFHLSVYSKVFKALHRAYSLLAAGREVDSFSAVGEHQST